MTTTTSAKVRIDAFPESAFRYLDRGTIVCIDVINACTTAVTAAAQGRRVLPAGDIAEAFRLAGAVPEALLAGEPLPGETLARFDITNGPSSLGRRKDRRPLVLLDGPGTRLIANCRGGREVYVACLRNVSATVEFLASRHHEVVLLAAGEGGDFRCEDKMAAARIGRALVERGFTPEGQGTSDVIERWGEADVSLLAWGRSADHLRSQGRQEEVDFVLKHVDDLDVVCRYRNGQLAAAGAEPPRAVLSQPLRGEAVV